VRGAAALFNLGDQWCELIAASATEANRKAAGRKPPRDRGANVIAGSHDECNARRL